jgi:hypothetical protein
MSEIEQEPGMRTPGSDGSAAAAADRASARAALAEAQAARGRVARSITYPQGYVASIALQAALLSGGAGAAVFVEDVPIAARVACLVSMLASIALGGVNIARFERHNGVRLRSMRFVRWPSGLYLLPILLLILFAANRVNVTGAWWAGFAAAPLVAGCAVLYSRGWLRDYHRSQGTGAA